MKIRVNGNDREVEEGIRLVSLMDQLGLKPQSTVVERNGAIVERKAYSETTLTQGDELELIRFVGGG